MDEITCGITSLLFSKEMLNAIKLNREPTSNDMSKGTPTTIKIYKDKVVWNDLGQDIKIIKDRIILKGLKNETIHLNLRSNKNDIHFEFIENN